MRSPWLYPGLLECRLCPRLAEWRESVAAKPPRRFRAWVAEHKDRKWWLKWVGAEPAADGYWARPIAAYGDPSARIAIVGLAPAAHGANRTGRIFTGDRSGDFLTKALFLMGFANQPESTSPDDGLALKDVVLTAALRCCPPANRPTSSELSACAAWLNRDLESLENLAVIVALGRIAHSSVVRWMRSRTHTRGPALPFAHGAVHKVPELPVLVDSYHVSQQNTFTGRLTMESFLAVLRTAAEEAGLEHRG